MPRSRPGSRCTAACVPGAGPAAPVLPAGARRITLRAQGVDADITLGLWLSTVDGRQQLVIFDGTGPELTAELPGGEARIVQGLEIAESEIRLTRREHARESGADRQVTAGRLRLEPAADRRPDRPLGLVGVGERPGDSSDSDRLPPTLRTGSVTRES